MLSKEYVETALRAGGYLDIFAAAAHEGVQSWFETVANSPNTMSGAIPREKAAHVNRRIVEIICNKLENDPSVVIYTKHQSTLITIDNKITLRFKKLNGQRRTMSIKTARVKGLWHRNMKPFEGDFDDWINVAFGWQFGTAGTIIELLIVFEFDDELQWYIDITGGMQAVTQAPTQLPLAPVDGALGYTATVRDTERARRIAEEDAKDNSEEAN